MTGFLDTSIGSSGGVDTGDIPASLRFRGAASAYLSRTFGTPTTQNGWALSLWIKVPPSSGTFGIFGTATSHPQESFYFDNGQLNYVASSAAGTNNLTKRSTRVLRDPTSPIHLFVRKTAAANSSTACIRFWINNEEITSWATNAYTGTQASVPDYLNTAVVQRLGSVSGGNYNDGYYSRIAFVDNGASLLPTDFAYLNTEINEWVSKSQSAVKAVVDAGGVNSFMLDFDDGTSLTTLGYDKSSKGNNWTLNNFSLTAGTSYDRMLDVPGNSFATLNPLDNVNVSNTLGEANCALTTPVGANYGPSLSSYAFSAGKWYCEFQSVSGDSTPSVMRIGITKTRGVNDYLGSQTGDVSYQGNGNKWNNGSSAAYGATFGTTGDVIGIAVDMDAGTVEFFKNGTSQGQAATGISGSYVFAIGDASSIGGGYKWAINSGQYPFQSSATYHSAAGGYFRYAPPTGFKALCQRNLPDPAILNPEKHFDVVARTGFGASGGSVSSLGFKPDFYWGKVRNSVTAHNLVDSDRGVDKILFSNLTNAETTAATFLTSFNANGYTMGAGDYTGSESVVEWLWKAGGAAVTNNAGSISSQVSANVAAGFSIVKHTNTGSPGTIGHGLGKAPGLIINKVYDRTENWRVYFGFADKLLFLNSTAAEATDVNIWNNTQPTSSVFSIGTYFSNGDDIISYCFAEIPGFSKIFSYTGNGSTDGPFVHCGFKPKFILLKNASAAGNGWIIYDAVRDTYNVMGLYLQPNTSGAEGAAAYIDAVSNGFKVRTANADANGSTNTIVGIAFADVPAKYALAR